MPPFAEAALCESSKAFHIISQCVSESVARTSEEIRVGLKGMKQMQGLQSNRRSGQVSPGLRKTQATIPAPQSIECYVEVGFGNHVCERCVDSEKCKQLFQDLLSVRAQFLCANYEYALVIKVLEIMTQLHEVPTRVQVVAVASLQQALRRATTLASVGVVVQVMGSRSDYRVAYYVDQLHPGQGSVDSLSDERIEWLFGVPG